jgi:hypothetical protein
MYVGVIHRIKDAHAAFSREERLMEYAPAGITGREFYPPRASRGGRCGARLSQQRWPRSCVQPPVLTPDFNARSTAASSRTRCGSAC